MLRVTRIPLTGFKADALRSPNSPKQPPTGLDASDLLKQQPR